MLLISAEREGSGGNSVVSSLVNPCASLDQYTNRLACGDFLFGALRQCLDSQFLTLFNRSIAPVLHGLHYHKSVSRMVIMCPPPEPDKILSNIYCNELIGSPLEPSQLSL